MHEGFIEIARLDAAYPCRSVVGRPFVAFLDLITIDKLASVLLVLANSLQE